MKLVPLSEMPLRARDWLLLLTASMEQIIGAALSTIVGVIIPLILLLGQPELTALDQGILGASGLIGIAIGSVIIGKLMDAIGYLSLFRLCPVLIAIGSACVCACDGVATLALSLFLVGFGVGGGYSLDSAYVSELMPARWQSFMVGLAKASSSLGFVGGAAISYAILDYYPHAIVWRYLMLFTAALGVLTFFMRIHWHQSPRWLMAKGAVKKAEQAARAFMGPEAEVRPRPNQKNLTGISWLSMFRGKHLQKVILSGITWACEGLGVYGFGVFLPILVMALGIGDANADGIPKIMDSVRTSTFINIFIGIGFALGLAVIHKMNMLRLMGWAFIICAGALGVLLTGYQLHWATWISFAAFVIFEVALNAGPHLVTYIIPSRIYDIGELGAGTGIATMLGKIGAVLGVFFMPALLSLGGVELVLWVSIAVQLLGAAVTFIYGQKLKLL